MSKGDERKGLTAAHATATHVTTHASAHASAHAHLPPAHLTLCAHMCMCVCACLVCRVHSFLFM
jgi:hypothetical protein